MPNQCLTKERLLTRREAAAYLTERGFRIAATTLGKLAVVGNSPKYRRWGRLALYATADLDTWSEARLGNARSNTSQVTNERGAP